MPSRQQQRKKAARDAALANRNVGDWTTQAEDPGVLCRALGSKSLVKQKADGGDRQELALAQLEDLREHIAHVTAQVQHVRDPSTGLLRWYGGQSKLALSGKGQSKLKFSGKVDECKPLDTGKRNSAWATGYSVTTLC